MLTRGNEEYFIQVLNECKNSNYQSLGRRQAFYDYSTLTGIQSLIMVTKGSCYFVDIRDEHYEWMKRLIVPELENMFYVSFKEDIFKRFDNEIHYPFRSIYHYHVMRLDRADFTPLFMTEQQLSHVIHTHFVDRTECRRLTINDFNSIKTLQYDYHLEEVYEKKDNYPYKVEMENLKRSLRNEMHYGFFINGSAAAKANVNSESKNIYQIGGVFTAKHYRHHHIAAHCLSALITECLKTKPAISLYVKQDNKTAIDLYKRLGFRVMFNTVLGYIN